VQIFNIEAKNPKKNMVYVTLCQSRLYLPVKDFGFSLRFWNLSPPSSDGGLGLGCGKKRALWELASYMRVPFRRGESYTQPRRLQKLNLKVPSGQIGSAWEWYHWIGLEKDINRYGFSFFFFTLHLTHLSQLSGVAIPARQTTVHTVGWTWTRFQAL